MVLYSDNSGAEKCTTGGAARSSDHNHIVHAVWLQAFLQRFQLWIERVPTVDNISDPPSRFDYRLLEELGAVWKNPSIANIYLEIDAREGSR